MDDQQTAKPRLDRRALIAIAVVGAVLIVAAAWFLLRPKDDPGLTLYGNVDIREVELGFRQGGRIAEMLVDEGDAVAAEQVLAALDAEPLREARAAASAEVERIEAESRAAQTNFDRQNALFRAGAISRRTWEAARAERDTSVASLAGARARRDQAETALADARLVAPAAGVILSRVPEPGAIVSAGATVYTLSLSDPVYVRAYVAETDLGRIAPGVPVVVSTDSSDRAYNGQIGFISPRAEFTPRSVETADLRTDLVYRIRIVVQDPDQGLRQGMPVTVRISTPNVADTSGDRQVAP